MADPIGSDNPLTTVLDAGAPKVRELVDQIKERVRDRAREAAQRRAGALTAGARGAATSRLPTVAPLPLPDQAKARPVAIRLPNGRRLTAVLNPGLATRSDVAAIVRASADNNRRAFGALQAQRAAIDRLQRSQDQLAAKLASLEKRADDAVLAITDTFGQSTRQLKRLAAQGEKAIARAGTAAATAVRTLAVTQQAQNLTNVVSVAQSTAYGERGSVLAPNNLLLTGNQLLWTFLGPASAALGASAGTATVLSLLAPLGSLLTGFAAVGSRVSDRKRERFISGIAVFDPGKLEYTESLRSRLPDDAWDDFRTRDDVPVTVNSIDPIGPDQASAEVRNGELRITVFTFFRARTQQVRYRFAWVVDTGVSGG